MSFRNHFVLNVFFHPLTNEQHWRISSLKKLNQSSSNHLNAGEKSRGNVVVPKTLLEHHNKLV